MRWVGMRLSNVSASRREDEAYLHLRRPRGVRGRDNLGQCQRLDLAGAQITMEGEDQRHRHLPIGLQDLVDEREQADHREGKT